MAESISETVFVDVAVPLPLDQALTYAVPAAWAELAQPGVRARVRVGKRSLLGVIVALRQEAPEGVKVRAVESVVDERPVLSEELLNLAAFISSYYLAPLGEVLRSMVPGALAPVGDKRVWLRNAGALAEIRDDSEAAVVATLLEEGRVKMSRLQQAVGGREALAAVRRLEAAGRVSVSEKRRRGVRYRTAVEVAQGDLDELRERCGRSPQGREVVEYLRTTTPPAPAQ